MCVDDRSAPAAGAPAPEGATQPPNLTSNRRLQQTQAQVDEVWFRVDAASQCRRTKTLIEFTQFTQNAETLGCFNLLFGI